jgi:hypothetical protein
MFVALAVLLALVISTLVNGASRLDLRLFTEYPASLPARAKARPAILGWIWGDRHNSGPGHPVGRRGRHPA